MKLFEYQAKEQFIKAGIPIPEGQVASTVEEAVQGAERIGSPVVVKAQLLQGGRGKAGLIRKANTLEEVRKAAEGIFQAGKGVRKVLVEQAVPFKRELYLSITLEPANAKALVMASSEGGVEIEQVAAEQPEKILQYTVDLGSGILPFHSRSIAYDLGLEGEGSKRFAAVLEGLWKVFRTCDAELAEINPLFLTDGQALIAGDGKLSIDDNSLFRHPEFEPGPDYFESPIAYEAYKEGIPYLQFDGDISLMCAGAGLTTTVYDLIHYEGGTVANYLEFGGPNYRKGLRAMELCLANNPKVVLIVSFGTIARADVMAQGIVEAIQKLNPSCPIVACIRGTGEEEAQKILKDAGIEPLFDTEEAVRIAVRYTREFSDAPATQPAGDPSPSRGGSL